jgi:hypothetical protein
LDQSRRLYGAFLSYGLSFNENNGVSNRGYKFDEVKKLSVLKQASILSKRVAIEAFNQTSLTFPMIAKTLQTMRRRSRIRCATMDKFSILRKRIKSERLGLVQIPLILWMHSPCFFCTSWKTVRPFQVYAENLFLLTGT